MGPTIAKGKHGENLDLQILHPRMLHGRREFDASPRLVPRLAFAEYLRIEKFFFRMDPAAICSGPEAETRDDFFPA